jgi:hypothetical protein
MWRRLLRGRITRRSKGRSSFWKKRSKKRLSVQLRMFLACRARGEGEQAKVFWFFFSKKNILS